MTTTTTAWMRQAACAGRPELPWTTDTVDVHPLTQLSMSLVCRDCAVRVECVAAVDDLGITGGWWAGADRDPAAVPMPAPEWVQLDLLGGAA